MREEGDGIGAGGWEGAASRGSGHLGTVFSWVSIEPDRLAAPRAEPPRLPIARAFQSDTLYPFPGP